MRDGADRGQVGGGFRGVRVDDAGRAGVGGQPGGVEHEQRGAQHGQPGRLGERQQSGVVSWTHSNDSGTSSSRWRARTAATSAAVGAGPPSTGRA
ncbi:hypothetical protein ACFQZ4_00195 [Catellatospora coxensis]